jgi:hypothetical protein
MDIINEKVTFVISNCRCVEGYQQAYLVGDNKSSLDTAKRWASGWRSEIIEGSYEVYETINKDFTLKIFEESQESSQGGKLSFWNCIVEKEDKVFMLGIQARSLCNLIKATTCINGAIQGSVSFYRNSNGVLVALTDSITFHDKTTKKTSKWEVGKIYSTKSVDDICLGKVNVPFDYDYNTKTLNIDFNRWKLAYHELHSLIRTLEKDDYDGRYSYRLYNTCDKYPSRYCTDDYGTEIVDKVHVYMDKRVDVDIKYIEETLVNESKRECRTNSSYIYDMTNVLLNFDISKTDMMVNVIKDIINFTKTLNCDEVEYTRDYRVYNSPVVPVVYHVNLVDCDTKEVTTYDFNNYYKASIRAYELIIEQINKIKNRGDK